MKNWHLQTLPKPTLQALEFLAIQSWLGKSKWYLAGGTALTLQVGHRKSVDLDFFLPNKTFKENLLVDHFSSSDWSTDFIEPNTIYGKLLGAKVSFIAYPYFVPKQKKLSYGAVRVLSKKDIAVMKIIAISQRGRKRDFFDLYWYLQNEEPLDDVFRKLPAQYPGIAHDYHHILKSLTYFDDAEHDPDPQIYFTASWKTVKEFFKKKVPQCMKQLLHLI